MLRSPFVGHMQSGDQFAIAEWTEDPCPPEGPIWVAPLHRHQNCDEAWYVLEGRLAFLVDGEEFVANSGSVVWVPRGAAHTYWNPDSAPARYLLIMTAKTQALISAIHQQSDRSVDSMRSLFESFDAEFIGFPD
jgi:mannose-6-phosphate isomerase-like protein (cupin superfamily)